MWRPLTLSFKDVPTCFPSFASMIDVPPSFIFSLSPSSCLLPQTGSASKSWHNLSLLGHFRAACIQVGVLRPSICSKVCYDPAFSPQDIVCRIPLSVVPYMFGIHTRQRCLGGWPDLALNQISTIMLYLCQVCCPAGWTPMPLGLLGFLIRDPKPFGSGILRVHTTLTRLALM